MATGDTNEAAIREATRTKVQAMPLDKIVGQPTRATFNHMKEQLAKMAAAIKSTKWGGRHGHLALVLDDEEYQTATGHGATLPDGTANTTEHIAKPPLVADDLVNGLAIRACEEVQKAHTKELTAFWYQEAIDDLLVE